MFDPNKVGTHCTTVGTSNGTTKIMYHSTVVVEFDIDVITLNNGGYFSKTTKRRMNHTSGQSNLGYKVYQKGGVWYVDYDGGTYPFEADSITLQR